MDRPLLVIARIVKREDGKESLLGYLIMDDGHVRAVPLPNALIGISQVPCLNAEVSTQFGVLNGTHGASLASYPAVNTKYQLVTSNGIIVYAVVEDLNTTDLVGVVAYNGLGQCFKLTMPKFVELASRHSCCNFKMVNTPRGLIPMMLDGTEFPVIKMSVPPKVTQKTLHQGNVVKQDAQNETPQLIVTTFIDDSVKQFDVDAQQKLTMSMMNMAYITPYYHCCLSAIKRMPAPGLGTFAVTEDTMFYDMQFVAKMAEEELIFVMIHEMMHIAMQHSVRFGKHRTSHDLWNTACDLYINSIICDNFGLRFGGPAVTITATVADKQKKVSIKVPDFGIYMETIGEKIDLSRDTPETIYERLVKENPEQAQQPGGNSKQGSGGGSGDGSSSNKSKKKQGQKQNDSSSGGAGQGQGSTNPGQSEGQQQSGGSGAGKGGQGGEISGDVVDKQLSENKTSGQTGMDNLSGENTPSGSELREVSVIYNGKRLTGKVAMDVMSNNDNKSADAMEKSRQESRAALQRINTKVKMTEQEQGQQLEKSAGLGGELVQRYIELGLTEGIRWQELLKSVLKSKPKKTFTLANPNQDYMNMGMTIASRRPIGKPTKLAGVIFGIDVSGSVSDKELQYCLSEIANIFKFYDVDAELIYWSTMVGDAGMFSSIKDMCKIKPVSDGGTDVRCVFDYIVGKTRVNGKTEPSKLKDIKAIFILTDGCFSHNYSDYAMLGKKVVWLVTSNPITFNPPFGRVIGFKLP